MKKVQLTVFSLLVAGSAFSQAITDNGTNVGIGNATPAHKLDVNGDINISSGSKLLINSRPVVSTVGTGNTFIGDLSGNAITTGSNNAFIGYKSGEVNTTGHSNAFIGFKAGELNTTGFSNAFIGQQAGRANISGKTNVMIGRRAGFTSASGDDNVFIGHLAGQTNNGGSSNTYLGSGADGLATLVNATAIGANASVAQDSSLILGDAAKVGIGTSVPLFDLDVAGDINFDGTLYNAGVPFTTGKLTCTPLYVGPTGPIPVMPNTVVMVDETFGPVLLDFPPGTIGDEIVVKSIAMPFSGFPGSGISITSPIPIEDPATPGAAYPPGPAATFVGGIMKEAYKWHYCDNVNGTPVWVLILDYEPHIEGEAGPEGPQGPTGPTGPAGNTSWTVAGSDQYSSVSGNVGVGISSPATKLHVHDATLAFASFSTDLTGSNGFSDGLVVGTQHDGDAFIYNYEDRNIDFGTNGSERLTLSNEGKLGINNTAPQNMLNVQGGINDTSAVVVINVNDTTPGHWTTALRARSIDADSTGIGIEAIGGSVGVEGKAYGTTSLVTNTAVGGKFTASAAAGSIGVEGIAIGSANPAFGVSGEATGPATINYGIYGNAYGASVYNWAGYFENGDVVVREKLAVGPTNNLNDKVTVSDVLQSKVSLNVRSYFSGDTSSLKLFEEGDYGFEFEYDGANDRLDLWSRKFSGNEAKRMTWTKDGNVGIGTASPNAKLEVTASGQLGVRQLQSISTTDNTFGTLAYSTNGGSGSANAIYCSGTSNSTTGQAMGIQAFAQGTSTSNKFAINASASGSGTLWAGYFSGDLYSTGSYLPSDRQLKTNIKDLDDASEILSKLKVHTYNYRTDKYPTMHLQEGERFGFIAEEMKEVLPQLVKATEQPKHINPDGTEGPELPDIDVVNYTELIPILTAAIQEQQAEIDQMGPAKVEALETELEAVKAKNAELENKLDQLLDRLDGFDSDLQQCCFNYEENAGSDAVIQSTSTSLSTGSSEESGGDSPILEQNQPNPFRENSVIKYYLPSSTRSAELIITDQSGVQLKSFNLQGKGFGQVMISGGSFHAGSYIYTLVINGERVSSKQMILL